MCNIMGDGMSVTGCRICGNVFFREPLLRYKDMPKSAQFLPDAKALQNDKGVDLEICQCSGCGLVQLTGEPVPYYREVIRAAAFSDEMKEFRLRQFSEFVNKYSVKGKNLIEVGCGKGEYLALMKQIGVEVYGLEYSTESVEQCIKNGLKAIKGFINKSNYTIDNAPFDVFFILNFFEHLPNPNVALKGIYNNLSDNAVGLVEVPNFDMMLKKNLFSEFIPDHLFYFTKETLCFTLKLNGFEIIECNEVWHDYIISAVVRKRSRLDITHFYEYQEKLRKEINGYLSGYGNKKVAIWGAGHQSLAVIAMTNIENKIKYVIDSAPFKQGKYTPATHIPIVSPDTLNSDPVDAIIVMAAAYSDEVAKIIREKFDKRIKISILRDCGLEIIQ